MFRISQVVFMFLTRENVMASVRRAKTCFRSYLGQGSPIREIVIHPAFVAGAFLCPSTAVRVASVASVVSETVAFVATAVAQYVFVVRDCVFVSRQVDSVEANDRVRPCVVHWAR